MSKIKLEVGKTYVNREGEAVKIDYELEYGERPFLSEGLSYTSEGFYLGRGVPSAYDLIAEHHSKEEPKMDANQTQEVVWTHAFRSEPDKACARLIATLSDGQEVYECNGLAEMLTLRRYKGGYFYLSEDEADYDLIPFIKEESIGYQILYGDGLFNGGYNLQTTQDIQYAEHTPFATTETQVLVIKRKGTKHFYELSTVGEILNPIKESSPQSGLGKD